MGMILRIASSRIVGQGDIVGRSGYFSLNLSANSVMRGRLDARRTLKSLVADLRINTRKRKKQSRNTRAGKPNKETERRKTGFAQLAVQTKRHIQEDNKTLQTKRVK